MLLDDIVELSFCDHLAKSYFTACNCEVNDRLKSKHEVSARCAVQL